MARKPRKPSLTSKPKLTKNQLQFQKELQNLRRRAKEWERKQGIKFTDFPTMPEHVTKKDIQRVKEIRLKNFTPQQVKQYRKEYQYRTGYEPPTEDDFYNGTAPQQPDEPEWDESWGEQSTDDYKTDAELDAWIEEKIEEITQPTLVNDNVPRELAEERKDELTDYMYNAKLRMGTRNFYEFLQDEETCAALQAAASDYVNESEGSKQTAFDINQFLTILNLGRPLTQQQEETASFYGRVDFDYTGTKYE